jgi:hypothetical protein
MARVDIYIFMDVPFSPKVILTSGTSYEHFSEARLGEEPAAAGGGYAQFALLLGLKRARDNHDGSCETVKSYAAGSKYCGAAGGKDHKRKSISADRRIVIYIFMNVPFLNFLNVLFFLFFSNNLTDCLKINNRIQADVVGLQ